MDYLQNPRRRSGVIYGENDWVEYDLVNLSIEFGSGKKLRWDDFDRNNMFIDEMKDFFKSMEENRESSISIQEGSKSLYLAEGILKSLNNKEEVEIEY